MKVNTKTEAMNVIRTRNDEVNHTFGSPPNNNRNYTFTSVSGHNRDKRDNNAKSPEEVKTLERLQTKRTIISD